MRLVGRGAEEQAVELRDAAEVQRGGDAVGVHVADAGVDVVTALAKLIIGGRLEAVFLAHAACDGVEGDRGHLDALVFPVLGAGRPGLQFRRSGQCLARQMPVEHIGRLGDVIVDADDHHVFHLHGTFLSRRVASSVGRHR
jgi:hypothetical protein